MSRGGTAMVQQGRGGLRRAPLPPNRGQNNRGRNNRGRNNRGRNNRGRNNRCRDNLGGKHGREENPQSGNYNKKLDGLISGELKEYIIAISNLGAIAKFILDRKPELLPDVKAFTKEYPELLDFIENGTYTELIPQSNIPLLTEWDDDESVEPAANEPAANEPPANEPPANEPATIEPTANEPAVTVLTPGTKEHLNTPIQEQTSGGQPIPVKMVKGPGLDGMPESLPDGAAPLGSPSAWMSYAQHPLYSPSWLPIPDQMSMAAVNTMPNTTNAQMFSTPFFFPSGSIAEYSFPPGTAQLGPLHTFQQPHHGQAVPQSGTRISSFTGYMPSTLHSGSSTEQVNPTVPQSIQSITGPRPDAEVFVPTQGGSQMPMEMNYCPPLSGQARDVTLWPSGESDDYITMMNDLPSIIC